MDDNSTASSWAQRRRYRGWSDHLTQESSSTVSPERGEGIIDESHMTNDFAMIVANPVPGLPQKPQLPPKPAKPTLKILKGEVMLPKSGIKAINPWRAKIQEANVHIRDAESSANDLYINIDHVHKTANSSINNLYKHLHVFQTRLAKAEKDKAEVQVKLQKTQSEKFAYSKSLTTLTDNFKSVNGKYSTCKARVEKLSKEKAALEEEVKSLKRDSRSTTQGTSEERIMRASQLHVDEHRHKLQDKLDIKRQKRNKAAQMKNQRLESFTRTNGMLLLGSTGMFSGSKQDSRPPSDSETSTSSRQSRAKKRSHRHHNSHYSRGRARSKSRNHHSRRRQRQRSQSEDTYSSYSDAPNKKRCSRSKRTPMKSIGNGSPGGGRTYHDNRNFETSSYARPYASLHHNSFSQGSQYDNGSGGHTFYHDNGYSDDYDYTNKEAFFQSGDYSFPPPPKSRHPSSTNFELSSTSAGMNALASAATMAMEPE